VKGLLGLGPSFPSIRYHISSMAYSSTLNMAVAVSLKRWYPSTRLQGVMFQKFVIKNVNIIRSSYPTWVRLDYVMLLEVGIMAHVIFLFLALLVSQMHIRIVGYRRHCLHNIYVYIIVFYCSTYEYFQHALNYSPRLKRRSRYRRIS
jgi:hypothetical protein